MTEPSLLSLSRDTYSYRPQTKFAKVMFLHVSVILFTGGDGITACIAGLQAHTQGEVGESGLEGAPGPHPGGKLRGLAWGGLQAHTWRVSRPTRGGSPDPHRGGLQVHPLPQKKTHPTGMHSCLR